MVKSYFFANFDQLLRYLSKAKTAYEVNNRIEIIEAEVIQDFSGFKVVKQNASNRESALIFCFYLGNEWVYWYPREYHFPALLKAVAGYFELDYAEKLIKNNIREVNKENGYE